MEPDVAPATDDPNVGAVVIIRPPPLSILGIDVAALTVEQKDALERMRKEFGSLDYAEKYVPNSTFTLDDYTYLKYLRARDYDFDKAQQILHKTLAWRNKMVPGGITATRPDIKILGEIMGKTKSGHPILYMETTDFFPNDYTVDSYLASRVFELEEAFRTMAADGWRVDRYVILCDLKAFKFLTHATPHACRLYKAFSEVLQSLYRESIHMIILVHALGAFQNLWSILKHLTRPETAKRILMMGRDYSELQEHIDPSNLYQHLYVLVTRRT